MFASVILSCNNSGETKANSKADSVSKEVDELHINAMAKWERLEDIQKEIQKKSDSISKLSPGNELAAYKQQLDSTLDRIKYADFAMQKWMDEFKYDSAKNDEQKRIEYLESEKNKIGRVRDLITSSLQKADSLLIKK